MRWKKVGGGLLMIAVEFGAGALWHLQVGLSLCIRRWTRLDLATGYATSRKAVGSVLCEAEKGHRRHESYVRALPGNEFGGAG